MSKKVKRSLIAVISVITVIAIVIGTVEILKHIQLSKTDEINMSSETLNITKYINDYNEDDVRKNFSENSSGKFCFAIDSESDFKIIVSDIADDYVLESANELSVYLNKIIGSNDMFEVIRESELKTEKFISVGHTTKASALDCSEIKDDGYLIKAESDGIYIITNDDQFISNGIYGFLEDQLECMFVREDYDYIPYLPTIYLEPFEYVSNPDFAWRKVFQYEVSQNNWYKKLKNNGAVSNDIETNNLWGTWCHDVFTFVPPEIYEESHPEYFAYNSENEPAQLCLTNEEIYPIIENKMAELISQNPDEIYWDFSINDNMDYCKCENCKKVLKQTGSMMGTMLPIINRLAKRFPDKIISTLAYTYNEKPPTGMKCEPNVNIVLAPISSGQLYSYSSEGNEKAKETKELIESWSQISSRLMIWDYVVDFSHLLMPYPNFDVQKDNHDLYIQNNVKAVFHQGSREKNDEMARIRSYILSKQLWDNSIDISKVLAKYIRVTYKDAAVYVAQYMDLMNQELKENGKDLDLYDKVSDHKNDYLSFENNSKYLEIINNAINSVEDERIKGYLEEIKINILYSIMNEKNMRYERKKNAFDEFSVLVKKHGIERPYETGILMDEYIEDTYPRILKRYSFFTINK